VTKAQESVLFVNKKNQKNFVTGGIAAGASEIPRAERYVDQSFFASFCSQKEDCLTLDATK